MKNPFGHDFYLRKHSAFNLFDYLHNIVVLVSWLGNSSWEIHLLSYFTWLLNLLILLSVILRVIHWWLFNRFDRISSSFFRLWWLIVSLLFFRFWLVYFRCESPHGSIFTNISPILFVFDVLFTNLFHIDVPMLALFLGLCLLDLCLNEIRFDLAHSSWALGSNIVGILSELIRDLSTRLSIWNIFLIMVDMLDLTTDPLIKLIVSTLLEILLRGTRSKAAAWAVSKNIVCVGTNYKILH